jgi:hypothetical protein
MVKKELNSIEGAMLIPGKREEVINRDKHVHEYSEEDLWICFSQRWNTLSEREVMVTMRRRESSSYVPPTLGKGWLGLKSEDFVIEYGWEETLGNG